MTKKLSFKRPNRRDFLRTGIIGGAGLVVAQFAAPKELRAQTNFWSGQVSQSSDDAFQFFIHGAVNLTSTTINVCASSNTSGFRFQNVQVPNSATISAASITFYELAGSAGNCTCYLQAADSALTFTAQNFNLLRPKTANSAIFTGAVTAGWTPSADLSAAVQEVVNRQPVDGSTGWVCGNAMAVLVIAAADIASVDVYTYDDDPIPPPNFAAILNIQWT